MVNQEDFTWSAKTYTPRELIESIGKKLPVIVKVTKGYYGGSSDIDIVSNGQMARIHSVVEQKRILVADSRNNFLSFPENLKIKFVVKQKTGKIKKKTLRDICQKYQLPITVTNDRKSKWRVVIENQQFTANTLGDLVVITPYTERFMRVNTINKGILDRRVTLIPLYLGIQMRLAEGWKDRDQESWTKANEMYSSSLAGVDFSRIQAPKEILRFSREEVKHRMGDDTFDLIMRASNYKQDGISRKSNGFVGGKLHKPITLNFNVNRDLEGLLSDKHKAVYYGSSLQTDEERSSLTEEIRHHPQPMKKQNGFAGQGHQIKGRNQNHHKRAVRTTESHTLSDSSGPSSPQIRHGRRFVSVGGSNADPSGYFSEGEVFLPRGASDSYRLYSSTGDIGGIEQYGSGVIYPRGVSTSDRINRRVKRGRARSQSMSRIDYGTTFIAGGTRDRDFGVYGDNKHPIFHSNLYLPKQQNRQNHVTSISADKHIHFSDSENSYVKRPSLYRHRQDIEPQSYNTNQRINNSVYKEIQQNKPPPGTRNATIIRIGGKSSTDGSRLVDGPVDLHPGSSQTISGYPVRRAFSMNYSNGSISGIEPALSLHLGDSRDISIATLPRTNRYDVSSTVHVNTISTSYKYDGLVLHPGVPTIEPMEEETLHIGILGADKEWTLKHDRRTRSVSPPRHRNQKHKPRVQEVVTADAIPNQHNPNNSDNMPNQRNSNNQKYRPQVEEVVAADNMPNQRNSNNPKYRPQVQEVVAADNMPSQRNSNNQKYKPQIQEVVPVDAIPNQYNSLPHGISVVGSGFRGGGANGVSNYVVTQSDTNLYQGKLTIPGINRYVDPPKYKDLPQKQHKNTPQDKYQIPEEHIDQELTQKIHLNPHKNQYQDEEPMSYQEHLQEKHQNPHQNQYRDPEHMSYQDPLHEKRHNLQQNQFQDPEPMSYRDPLHEKHQNLQQNQFQDPEPMSYRDPLHEKHQNLQQNYYQDSEPMSYQDPMHEKHPNLQQNKYKDPEQKSYQDHPQRKHQNPPHSEYHDPEERIYQNQSQKKYQNSQQNSYQHLDERLYDIPRYEYRAEPLPRTSRHQPIVRRTLSEDEYRAEPLMRTSRQQPIVRRTLSEDDTHLDKRGRARADLVKLLARADASNKEIYSFNTTRVDPWGNYLYQRDFKPRFDRRHYPRTEGSWTRPSTSSFEYKPGSVSYQLQDEVDQSQTSNLEHLSDFEYFKHEKSRDIPISFSETSSEGTLTPTQNRKEGAMHSNDESDTGESDDDDDDPFGLKYGVPSGNFVHVISVESESSPERESERPDFGRQDSEVAFFKDKEGATMYDTSLADIIASSKAEAMKELDKMIETQNGPNVSRTSDEGHFEAAIQDANNNITETVSVKNVEMTDKQYSTEGEIQMVEGDVHYTAPHQYERGVQGFEEQKNQRNVETSLYAQSARGEASLTRWSSEVGGPPVEEQENQRNVETGFYVQSAGGEASLTQRASKAGGPPGDLTTKAAESPIRSPPSTLIRAAVARAQSTEKDEQAADVQDELKAVLQLRSMSIDENPEPLGIHKSEIESTTIQHEDKAFRESSNSPSKIGTALRIERNDLEIEKSVVGGKEIQERSKAVGRNTSDKQKNYSYTSTTGSYSFDSSGGQITDTSQTQEELVHSGSATSLRQVYKTPPSSLRQKPVMSLPKSSDIFTERKKDVVTPTKSVSSVSRSSSGVTSSGMTSSVGISSGVTSSGGISSPQSLTSKDRQSSQPSSTGGNFEMRFKEGGGTTTSGNSTSYSATKSEVKPSSTGVSNVSTKQSKEIKRVSGDYPQDMSLPISEEVHIHHINSILDLDEYLKEQAEDTISQSSYSSSKIEHFNYGLQSFDTKF